MPAAFATVAAAVFGTAAVGAALAAPAPPAPGRYAGELCVATRPGEAPGCGPAEIELRAGGELRVTLADIVYRLRLRTSQLDVTTMQGRMQIDSFDAPYEWSGRVLRFEDAAKSVRYEVRLGPRRPPGR